MLPMRDPDFTPSLSSSVGGFRILSAQLAALLPSSKTASPSVKHTRRAPSTASTDCTEAKGTLTESPAKDQLVGFEQGPPGSTLAAEAGRAKRFLSHQCSRRPHAAPGSGLYSRCFAVWSADQDTTTKPAGGTCGPQAGAAAGVYVSARNSLQIHDYVSDCVSEPRAQQAVFRLFFIRSLPEVSSPPPMWKFSTGGRTKAIL